MCRVKRCVSAIRETSAGVCECAVNQKVNHKLSDFKVPPPRNTHVEVTEVCGVGSRCVWLVCRFSPIFPVCVLVR